MSKPKKTLERVFGRRSDQNIPFHDMCGMLETLGFRLTVKGSHHSFRHPRIAGRIVIQPRNAKCKGYQVAQIRDLIIDNGVALNLILENDDDKDTQEDTVEG